MIRRAGHVCSLNASVRDSLPSPSRRIPKSRRCVEVRRQLVKSLWSSIQGDPASMQRVNGRLTIFWIAMIPISIATGWINSVAYVASLSILGSRIGSLVGLAGGPSGSRPEEGRGTEGCGGHGW